MIPGQRLARCLSPRQPAEKDAWHAIQGLEVCKGLDQRLIMSPEERDAWLIVDGSSGK